MSANASKYIGVSELGRKNERVIRLSRVKSSLASIEIVEVKSQGSIVNI